MKYEIKHRITSAVMWSGDIGAMSKATAAEKLGVAIREAVKARADLRGAYLTRAYLRGADLTGADLTGADLRGADLRGAYLTGADLTGAYLRGADLRGADLRGAYLRGAYLRGADLTGAYLRGADLRGNKPIEGEIDRPTDQIQGLRGRAYRQDGYEFAIFRMGDDGLVIRAGCRTFTPDEFEAHIVKNYNGEPKADETRRIIAFLIDQASAEIWF